MYSIQFDYLFKRLLVLRKALLPPKFSPTGNYKNQTYEKARAYKVLTHAEFEYYFEEISYTIAKNAYNKWKDHNIASPPLLALCVYYSGSYSPIPDRKDGNLSGEDINKRVKDAFTDYASRVKSKNHGIKESNVLQLLLPIGLEASKLDNDLLIALNNYSASRGEIAHSTRAKQVLTPKDAMVSAMDLLHLIMPLDEYLNSMI